MKVTTVTVRQFKFFQAIRPVPSAQFPTARRQLPTAFSSRYHRLQNRLTSLVPRSGFPCMEPKTLLLRNRTLAVRVADVASRIEGLAVGPLMIMFVLASGAGAGKFSSHAEVTLPPASRLVNQRRNILSVYPFLFFRPPLPSPLYTTKPRLGPATTRRDRCRGAAGIHRLRQETKK